jgi:hypothetical protein
VPRDSVLFSPTLTVIQSKESFHVRLSKRVTSPSIRTVARYVPSRGPRNGLVDDDVLAARYGHRPVDDGVPALTSQTAVSWAVSSVLATTTGAGLRSDDVATGAAGYEDHCGQDRQQGGPRRGGYVYRPAGWSYISSPVGDTAAPRW